MLHLKPATHINFLLDTARIMGSDVTAKALQHQIPRFRNIGKLQLQALQSGGDPKDVDIGTTVKDNQGQKLAVYFSFCTAHFLLHISFLHAVIPISCGTTY